MKKDGYYSSGQFARMAGVTLRTIRYYDQHDILKPSLVTEAGARFYTDGDFARLQQILLLKYLGFSLEDIQEMTIEDPDSHFMLNALNIQLKLVQDRIEQMQLVEKTLKDTAQAISEEHTVDWSRMLDLIHLTVMEKSLKNQYQNASNISSRINLHSLYSVNQEGWFPWIFDQCHMAEHSTVLEIGCGDGSLWLENKEKIPKQLHVVLSDISEGMLRDTRRAIHANVKTSRFDFQVFDCERIPYPDNSFDLVIANHILFYCKNLTSVFEEISRVLKTGGTFVCSTYGAAHMKEINELVSEFDDRIVLSADRLFERFGKENGADLLAPYFQNIKWLSYEDSLHVTEPETLISYVLSCHGNQNQYIIDHYKEFRNYVRKKTEDGFTITKDAGIFITI